MYELVRLVYFTSLLSLPLLLSNTGAWAHSLAGVVQFHCQCYVDGRLQTPEFRIRNYFKVHSGAVVPTNSTWKQVRTHAILAVHHVSFRHNSRELCGEIPKKFALNESESWPNLSRTKWKNWMQKKTPSAVVNKFHFVQLGIFYYTDYYSFTYPELIMPYYANCYWGGQNQAPSNSIFFATTGY